MLVLDTWVVYYHHIMVYYLSHRINGYGGGNPQTRMSPLETHGLTVVHKKSGPLQTIFGLHPNEVTDKNLTCLFVSSVQICKI